jgi:hypothetical protein
MSEMLPSKIERKPRRKVERAIGAGLIALSALISHVVTERSGSAAVAVANNEYRIAENADADIASGAETISTSGNLVLPNTEAPDVARVDSINDLRIRTEATRTINVELGLRALGDLRWTYPPNSSVLSDAQSSYNLITDPTIREEVQQGMNIDLFRDALNYVYSYGHTNTAPINQLESHITSPAIFSELRSDLNQENLGINSPGYNDLLNKEYKTYSSLYDQYLTTQNSLYSFTGDNQTYTF